MKKILSLSMLSIFLSACTISDVYWKPDVGPNNVGTNLAEDGSVATNFCLYLFGIFKLSSDCSPDKIAKENGFKTITQVNTQNQILYPVTIQRTTISGIK